MTKSTITREPITHDLKIYPEFFSAVCTGVKRAELRKNDRDYRVGDTLHLMETPRGSFHQTGEFINVKITHIADVGEWMPGYVLMSIELQERRKSAMDSEPVILYRQVNPVNGMKTYWAELDPEEFRHLKQHTDENAEFLTLYRHAQPAPEYPEVLPCPVLLEPGLRFGKGIKTSTMLAALARRAVYESDMAALSPEERAEFQARIEDFKSLIEQPAPVVPVVPEEMTIMDACKFVQDMRLFDDVSVIVMRTWNACRATMLQASPVCTCPSGDGSLRWPCPVHPGNSPAIPDGYVMVPKEPTEEMLQASYREASVYSPTAYRAMIAAAPQEGK